MDRVSKSVCRTGLIGVSIAALAVLAGCNEAPPPAPPPPAAAYQPAPPPPPLLGAPPQRDFVAMAPIPNPEDMPPAERLKIYGEHYHSYHHGDRSPGWWLRLHGYKAGLAAHPVVTAPVQAAAAPAPQMAATPKPVAAPAASPIAQLAAAVAAKSKGAMLAVPADLSAKKPGAVTLSLPADLFAAIRDEAAKLGLGHAARKTDLTATLHGDGYTITPPGPQTAHLAAGKPASFTWQVTPGPGAKGPLTADVSALMKGVGDAKSFSLAELKQAVAAVDAGAAQAKAATHGFKLPSLDLLTVPGHPDFVLPLFGKTPSKSVVAGVIALIVIMLLIMAARASGAQRQATERRRRYRTMATSADPDHTLADAAPVTVQPHVEHVVAAPAEHDAVAEHAVEYPMAVESAVAHPAEPIVAESEPVVADHVVADPIDHDRAPEQIVAEPADHTPVVEQVVAEDAGAAPAIAEPVTAESAAEHPVAEPVAYPEMTEGAAAEQVVAEPGAETVATPVVAEPTETEHEPDRTLAAGPVWFAPPAASVVGLRPAEPENHEHPFDPIEHHVAADHHAATEAHGDEPAAASHPEADQPVVVAKFEDHHPELETV